MKRHILYKELASLAKLNRRLNKDIDEQNRTIYAMQVATQDQKDNTRTARSRIIELEDVNKKQHLDLDACRINAREIMGRANNAERGIKKKRAENERLTEKLAKLQRVAEDQALELGRPLPKPDANMKHIGDEI